ncbi:MAG: hypothetical protein IKZ89_06555 [Bacteroidaceae bacterium]|nr:hypothetical protein [Bacteroidaceae bacterium]
MKKLLIACIIVSATVLNACKQKKGIYYTPREITASADVPQTKLPLERMDLECYGVHDIVAVDSMIVLFTSNKQSMIQVFDYSGQPIAKLSPSGRAGNEFLQVRYTDQNTVIDGDRYLYVESDGHYYLYNLSGSIRNGANLKPTKMLDLSDDMDLTHNYYTLFRPDGSYFQYKGVSHNEIIIPSSAVTANADGSISLNGYKIPEFEYYPPQYRFVKNDGDTVKYDIFPRLPQFNKPDYSQYLYYCQVRMSDDGTRVVAVSLQDRMTFINLESGDVFGVRGPDFVDFAQNADKDDILSSVVVGVMQVVTCGDYIYVLYDHNTVQEEEENDAPVNPTIRVFTWDGSFVTELIPDAPITNFFIDNDTHRLFAYDWDEQFYTADLHAI